MQDSNYFMNYYWLNKQFGGSYKWKTFIHNGVMFPKEYETTNIPVIYNGEKIYLEGDAEESAFLYAKYIDTEYVKNRIFNKNFWNDWKKILNEKYG